MSEGNLLSECKSSAAARKLAISCISPYTTDLGGAWIAPESAGQLTNGWVVVVRAHFDQTLAAQCPADIRYECQQAVVVDSVVWSSNPYSSNGATPTPYRQVSPVVTPPQVGTTASSAGPISGVSGP
jgi:hypothetical protein